MARAQIRLVYDKATGRHELIFDLEQETLDQRRHNARHEQLVREFVGDDAAVETVAPADAPRERAGGGTAGPARRRERES